MKNCPKCLVEVKSNRKTCPLCGQLLEGSGNEKPTYPSYQPISKRINLFVRIILFITIVSALVTIIVNILTYEGTWWAVYVILGLFYSWIVIKSTIMSKKNVAKKLFVQMLAVSLIVIVIEKISQTSGWALDYTVPSICSLTLISIITAIIFQQMRYNDYLLYLLTAILISFVPMILYWTHVVDILWPSVTSGILGIVTIIGMIIFADRATEEELKKRFHI